MAASLRTVFCPDLFRGKVAVVTGGGTGIGKAITKELARLGCKVVIASRKLERLDEAAAEINRDLEGGVAAAGGHVAPSARVFSFECNIRNEAQVCNLIAHPNMVEQHVGYIRCSGARISGRQKVSNLIKEKMCSSNEIIT